MSFGFEVRGPDGSVTLDTTTWGWQFATVIGLSELNRNLNFVSGTNYWQGSSSGGSMVFDGQGGRPFVPAGAELYAMTLSRETRNANMIWNQFYYEVQGAFRRLRWSPIRTIFPAEDNSSYDPDRIYRSTIYVFSR